MEAYADSKSSANPNTFGEFGRELTFDIEDVADKGSEYSLEKHGFTYVQHASQLTEADWNDQEKVKAVYYPETEELIKKA
jgi:hypothetical protein